MSTSVMSWVASVRPGVKGTVTSWPAADAAISTPTHPPRTIMSAIEMFASEASLISSRRSITDDTPERTLTSQLTWGSRRMRAPLAPPRWSVCR